MAALEHIRWMETAPDITIEAFATRFSYANSRPAYAAFLSAVNESGLNDRKRNAVIKRFNTWEANKSGASLFWEQQRQSVSLQRQSASIVIGKSVATKGLVDAASNELSKAIQNETSARREEDDESSLSTPQERKRNSRYQVYSTANKRVRNDDGEGDDGGDDSRIGGDEPQYEESFREEEIQELLEIEKNAETGFGPLIRALYHAARGEGFQKPTPKPRLSIEQSFLWDFVHSRLDAFGTMTPSAQKDMFVAVSGIVDLELHRSFPGRDELVQWCRARVIFTHTVAREQMRSYQEFVDVRDGVEEARLDDLKHRLRKDKAQFQEGSTEMIVAEILMILVKQCVSDKFGRAKRSESTTLFVWYKVWDELFASTAVEVEVGDTILKEAQKDQTIIRDIVGSNTAPSRAGASGRKLDFRLIATIKSGQRYEPFTLSNNEHKCLGSSDLIADIQRKKNMRLNKSIVMNGKMPMVNGTVYQDVVGLEGTWNIMCPFGDVMLCCKTEETPLRLPSNEFELASFLLGDGMERLLAYREHILSLSRQVQGLVSNPRRTNASRRAQAPVQSELGVLVHAQPPRDTSTTTPTTWTGAKGYTGSSTGATALVTKAAATGASQTCITTTVLTTEEWTDAISQPTSSTPPRASNSQMNPPSFFTPPKRR
ncbi:hypothetical protein FBU30_010708 [Linnemannia zychae]|nr:hypothetical protein FBU30_010708 [Linnemannia zychae]